MAQNLYGFDEESGKRVVAATRRVERVLGTDAGDTIGKRTPSMRFHLRGVLTATLDRGSLDAPETATMHVYVYDESDAAWSANGETITIQDTGMIATGTTLPVGCQVEASYVGGAFCLAAYDCDLEEITEATPPTAGTNPTDSDVELETVEESGEDDIDAAEDLS